ncbi:hypothetical protein RyT2_18300 [Pseudolactococcus yaeyamensis]
MEFSKCKKALAAVTIASALTGAALLVAPTDFATTTVAYAATSSIDFSQVDAAIAKYNALKEADYTATSWANLKQVDPTFKQVSKMVSEMKNQTDAVIEEAGYGTIAEIQAKLNDFATLLNTGIDTVLVKKSEVVNINFTAIKAAIARYNALNQADYTPESWAAFQATLVYDGGEAFDVAEYAQQVAELEALSPDELVYYLRATGVTATDLQNELDNNAAALNERIDILVAASPAQPQTQLANTGALPTTSAPAGAVAKTNVAKETSLAPLALLASSALAILGSAAYKIRKEN